MKKYLIVTLLLAFIGLEVHGQVTPVSGILTHTKSYFNLKAFSSAYDDGSYAKIFYDGNKKVVNFWNSDSGTPFTSIGVANIVAKGKIETSEIKVSAVNGADFVFEEDYDLPSLTDIEGHIKQHKHLPEIASADEMLKDGVDLAKFQIQLLQKIEELTLYTIQQEKKIEKLEKENEAFSALNDRLLAIEKQLNEGK